MSKPDISTSVGSIQLSNPFLLASGILDENGYTMRRILDEGAAAVVTKSIGMEERSGYKPPIVSVEDPIVINAVGLPNPGILNVGNEIKIAKKNGKPVVGSIFGKDVNEFVYLAGKMEEYGTDAIELNLSCPHVKGFGSEIGGDPSLVKEIVENVKGSVKIPVWSKLSPNVTSLIDIAKAASDSDAIVLINTVRGMKIDIRSGRPVLTNRLGGLSGPSIKPVGIRCVYEVKSSIDIPVIGVGGIESAADAIEYIMAGASAVQIGTALWKYGRGIFSKVATELKEFMATEGYTKIDDLKGLALI
ncbi:MAG: dihydroorotate dehydrogenase [Thermoplasmataceae archaeon]